MQASLTVRSSWWAWGWKGRCETKISSQKFDPANICHGHLTSLWLRSADKPPSPPRGGIGILRSLGGLQDVLAQAGGNLRTLDGQPYQLPREPQGQLTPRRILWAYGRGRGKAERCQGGEVGEQQPASPAVHSSTGKAKPLEREGEHLSRLQSLLSAFRLGERHQLRPPSTGHRGGVPRKGAGKMKEIPGLLPS